MPVTPDSPYSQLPVLRVTAPDGSVRQVVALRLARPTLPFLEQVRVQQSEGIDLLARRVYGDERLWWRILDANPLIHPLDIAAGMTLSIPAPGPATRVTRARSF